MNDANSTDSLEAEIIRLLSVVQKCVAQALLSPPKLTPALVRAFYPRKKQLRNPPQAAKFGATSGA